MVERLEARLLLRLGIEGLDDADAGEVLVHSRHDMRDAFKRLLCPALDLLPEDDDGEDAKGQEYGKGTGSFFSNSQPSPVASAIKRFTKRTLSRCV